MNPEGVPQLEFDPTMLYCVVVDVSSVIATDDVAAVGLTVTWGTETWIVQGSAKRMPGDRVDRKVGLGLAMARALEKMARQVARQANGKIAHNDHLAERHAKLKKQAQKLQKARSRDMDWEKKDVG